jgi:hypothetical protein
MKLKPQKEYNKQYSSSRRVAYFVAAAVLFVGAPVLASILVQNFTQFNTVVADPPVTKLQGADADYDGDADDSTGYLQVNLGTTISNSDDLLGTPGADETLLSHEEITFTCFKGDRTYYTDVMQLDNTTAAESWDVSLLVEPDLGGNPAVEDTFTAGDADIWLFTSAIDSTGGAITEIPNPGNYGTLVEWQNAAAPNGAIQMEVVGGAMSIAQGTTGPFALPAGEQRQIGLVVDCGAAMVNGETGTFRMTVSATPS